MREQLAWNAPEAFALTGFRCPDFRSRILNGRAEAGARLHPLVGDWICAAPILVCALGTDRYFQGLFDVARQRGKLTDALRACDLPTPLRRVRLVDVKWWASSASWREAFPALRESELAQMLPRINVQSMRALNQIWRRRSRIPIGDIERHREFARWAVRISLDYSWPTIVSFLDFMAENAFDLTWSPARFRAEHEAWVRRQNEEFARAMGVDPRGVPVEFVPRATVRGRRAPIDLYQPVDFGHRPLSGVLGGVQFEALNSPFRLGQEGLLMQHCVGGAQFRDALLRGRAFFYHLTWMGERSTLEVLRVRGRDVIGQHYGPRNHLPHPALSAAASALIAMFSASADLEKQP